MSFLWRSKHGWKDAFQAFFLPFFSFPSDWNPTANQTPHQPKRKMRRQASSPALTTCRCPSTLALGNAARCRSPCASSCSTAPPQRYRAAPRWRRRRLRLLPPGCWSQKEKLEPTKTKIGVKWQPSADLNTVSVGRRCKSITCYRKEGKKGKEITQSSPKHVAWPLSTTLSMISPLLPCTSGRLRTWQM